jgi:hypothetical protein
MGEYAEMMLDGACCCSCGEHLGGGDGHPDYCASCKPQSSVTASIKFKRVKPSSEKLKCPECKKSVNGDGLDQHTRAKHPERWRAIKNLEKMEASKTNNIY